jgi:hypothetical protein
VTYCECSTWKTFKEKNEGYVQLGLEVAGFLTATASVLKQAQRDDVLERLMQDNIHDFLLYVVS